MGGIASIILPNPNNFKYILNILPLFGAFCAKGRRTGRMKTMKQKYTLNIADLQISVISDAPAEEVQKIGGILDRKMREIYLKSRCPKTEAALLCALECVAERIGLTERTAELEDKCVKYGVVLEGLKDRNAELTAELEGIEGIAVKKTRDRKLDEFQKKLASLTFLDPACGSGNFLTETYLTLRRLENKAVMLRLGDQIIMGDTDFNPIQVSIGQFYGIEINDFAVSVAKTAMWIAEYQMREETSEIVKLEDDFLPLKSYANIHQGNAIRTDWQQIVKPEDLAYIIGNPPFLGYSNQNSAQKEDLLSVFVDEKGKAYKNTGKIDYVAGWYMKSALMMQANPKVQTALVSTNSITQGEQVANIWKPLVERFGLHIDFAWRTFCWDSESSGKAHVHCVIIGFSIGLRRLKEIM